MHTVNADLEEALSSVVYGDLRRWLGRVNHFYWCGISENDVIKKVLRGSFGTRIVFVIGIFIFVVQLIVT